MPASEEQELLRLAWAGWLTWIPSDWRPLKIEHKTDGGLLVLGDNEQAIARIRWTRPDEDFDPDRWLTRRIEAVGPGSKPADGAPAADRFDETLWMPDVHSEGDVVSSIWFGYRSDAQLILEIVINGVLPRRVFRKMERLVLPAMDAAPATAPTRWAVFNTSFQTPPGFRRTQHQIKLGNVALELERGRERLSVRQVYPSGLAERRRKMENWAQVSSLKDRRSLRSGELEPLQVDSFGAELEGWLCRGRKVIPFPFSGIMPRDNVIAVLKDEELDRLLIAEHETPRGQADDTAVDCVSKMNWARFEEQE
jgi:hypothetical protein